MGEITINRSNMSDDEYIESLENAIEFMNAQSYMLGDCIEMALVGLEMVINIAEISVDQNRNGADMIEDLIAEGTAINEDVHLTMRRFAEVASGGEIH